MSARILIVEDNADNMKLLCWMLEDAGYRYDCAATAEEALRVLEHEAHDLVLMDVSLPGMDGTEATRRLRRDARFEKLPVIAVTAHAILEEEEHIWKAGVTALVTKPVEESALLEEIQKSLHRGIGRG